MPRSYREKVPAYADFKPLTRGARISMLSRGERSLIPSLHDFVMRKTILKAVIVAMICEREQARRIEYGD